MGNLCRSPVGERMLQQKLPDHIVRSAGLSAVTGQGIDPDFGRLASEYGVGVDDHSARQLTPEMCRKQDLILVMERRHIAMMASIAPYVQGKTLLFGHWQNHLDIRDPFRRSPEAHQLCIQQLLISATGWISALSHTKKWNEQELSCIKTPHAVPEKHKKSV